MQTQEMNCHDTAIMGIIFVIIMGGLGLFVMNLIFILNREYNGSEILKNNLLILGFISFLIFIFYLMFRYHFIINFKQEKIIYRASFSKGKSYTFDELKTIHIYTQGNYMYYFTFSNGYQIKINPHDRSITRTFDMKYQDIIMFFQDNYHVKVIEI